MAQRNALGEIHDPFADEVPARQVEQPPPRRTMMEVQQRSAVQDQPATPKGTAAIPAGDGVRLGRFTVTPVGLVANGFVSAHDWEQFYTGLKKITESVQWATADWLLMGERQHGKTYQQMAALTGLKDKTLRDYAYVARSVHLSIRIDKLSFAHHQLVAGMPPEQQAACLRAALDGRMSVGRFRAYLEGREVEKLTALKRTENRLVRLYSQLRTRKAEERRQMALMFRQVADALEMDEPPAVDQS